jgi:hypothetical protein
MIMVDDRNRFLGDLEDNRWPSAEAHPRPSLDLCGAASEA